MQSFICQHVWGLVLGPGHVLEGFCPEETGKLALCNTILGRGVMDGQLMLCPSPQEVVLEGMQYVHAAVIGSKGIAFLGQEVQDTSHEYI